MAAVTPKSIGYELILSRKRQGPITLEKPPKIPGINVPDSMIQKLPQVGNPLSLEVRGIFNAITADNIYSMKEKLKLTIQTKVRDVEALGIIAEEVMRCLIDTENNIEIYFPMINFSHSSVIIYPIDETGKAPRSKSLGYFFILKCRDEITKNIDEKEINKLAQLSLEDGDTEKFNKYNDERSKTFNLITVICRLYRQRHSEDLIKIKSRSLYEVINILLEMHDKCQKEMDELGDPTKEESECKDEDAYFLKDRMAHIYAEYIYSFIEGAREIINDAEANLCTLVDKFKETVIPKMSQAYLKAKCKQIGLTN